MMDRSAQREPRFVLAIAGAAGISALARPLGLAQPWVSRWRRVPAERSYSVGALALAATTAIAFCASQLRDTIRSAAAAPQVNENSTNRQPIPRDLPMVAVEEVS